MTFPDLSQPSLFIASPGDVASFRSAVDREFRSLRDAVADDRGVSLYRWEVDTAVDGFDDARPAQEQVYLPSDPLCRAVICIVGEKVGTPLPSGFPLGSLAKLPTSDGFRLVHPWVPGEEEHGGFPLTGTVFEYLTALEGGGQPPTLLLIVGDESVLTESNPLRARWGFARLQKSAMARFGDAMDERWDWERDAYRPQRLQLSNFVRYLTQCRGHVVDAHNLVADEAEARTKVRRFLARVLDYRTRADHRSPFKKLEPYDTADMHVFFGRSQWRTVALGAFERLWSERAHVPFFGVVGGSGTGKSSLLRAALMAHLLDRLSLGDYCGGVFTPAELFGTQRNAGTPEEPLAEGTPLARLVARLVRVASPGTDASAVLEKLAALKPELQISAAVTELTRLLGSEGERRLLIGLDQFESLVDASIEEGTQRVVEQLFRFVRACVETRRIGVLYTLQTNRLALLADNVLLGPLCEQGHTQAVGFPPPEALEEIIAKPFEMVDMRLAPSLHAALRSRIAAFAEARSAATQGSLLPLISLQLDRLYEANAGRRQALKRTRGQRSIKGNSSADLLVDEQDAVVEVPLAGNERYLAIEDAIAHFAEQAYKEVERDAYFHFDEDTIDNLLQRLVRPLAAADERIDLPAARLPDDPAVRRLADELVQRRLLIPEAGGRVRLVHEAMLRHWPRARAWLDDQLRVLGFIAIARVRAEEWSRGGRSATGLKGDVNEAAEILAKCSNALTDLADDDVGDLLLRDYCLALLGEHPDPSRRVERSKKAETHLYLASAYSAHALCAELLEVDSASVHAETARGRTAVYAAAIGGSLPCLELLIGAGAALDHADVDGWRPIHGAAWEGRLDVLAFLLRAGVDPNVGGRRRVTPLHLAAQRGREAIAALLLDHPGCDPLTKDDDGETALSSAALAGHAEIVRRLLAVPGIDPLEPDFSPVHVAARYGHAAALEALTHHPAFDPNRPKADGWYPLLLAALPASAGALEVLLACERTDLGVRMNGKTALHVAAEQGRLGAVDALLEHGTNGRLGHRVDPNAVDDAGDTALHLAVRAGRRDIVVRLLADERTAPQVPNLMGVTAVGAARQKGHELLELLLDDARVDPARAERDGATPLRMAAEAGLVASARRMLDRGLDLSVPEHAADVLYFAAGAGDTELVRALLTKPGVDPWARTNRKATPLHRAISRGNLEIVDLLLRHGPRSDVDLLSTDVISAASIRRDTLEILARLLADGRFDPNVADGNGRTALHHATLRGHIDGVRVLVGHPRVDAGARDDWGRTFVDYAPQRHHAAIEQLAASGRDSSTPFPL